MGLYYAKICQRNDKTASRDLGISTVVKIYDFYVLNRAPFSVIHKDSAKKKFAEIRNQFHILQLIRQNHQIKCKQCFGKSSELDMKSENPEKGRRISILQMTMKSEEE